MFTERFQEVHNIGLVILVTSVKSVSGVGSSFKRLMTVSAAQLCFAFRRWNDIGAHVFIPHHTLILNLFPRHCPRNV